MVHLSVISTWCPVGILHVYVYINWQGHFIMSDNNTTEGM